MNVFDKGDAAAVHKARKLAEEVFGEGWEGKGAGIYEEGPQEVQIWGIGDVSVVLCEDLDFANCLLHFRTVSYTETMALLR
jgi:hypothetical protein